MSAFAVGQRWISHADSELGLGLVVEFDGKRVTIHFPAVDEDRTYAIDNAPLTRLQLKEGDALHTRDGRSLRVRGHESLEGLLVYEAEDDSGLARVPELELSDRVDLATPRQRLLASQFDNHAAFSLRLRTAEQLHTLQSSGLRGLLGTRTALLPHQLFIANEVGKRDAPRVLLADEVGLGKTIEAGMILHRQILTGAAQRVLVLVPESLQFQWLVEMRRRFNLPFSLFDEERFGAAEESNPFEDEQLVLCPPELVHAAQITELALAAPWDLVVVDEAHRIAPGSEDFQFLEKIAAHSPGLLLLTATPEQVGQEAHFARLALLDPERFYDFDAYRAQEQTYRTWSDMLDALDSGETPAELPEDVKRLESKEGRINALVDRYGTGRVMFRNTRTAVGGFPTRELVFYPLESPGNPAFQNLYPDQELAVEDWLQTDPRVSWLVDRLRDLRPAKVLVICAAANTALALEEHLQLRSGIRSAAFHEHLSIIERDRAAAYFAERDQGAQVLICSEIGGEGRNFQFAQHLVLFDLPEHPDQLEQRIGRLDRIGQRDKIYIHIPHLSAGAQNTLVRWYHEGIDLFSRSCSAGDLILERFGQRLDQQLESPTNDLDQLIAETTAFTEETREALSLGRDRLLERSSCDPQQGQNIAEQIDELEDPASAYRYLEQLCAAAGVHHEEHSEHTAIIRRGEEEVLTVFSDLPEEGATVTLSRARGLEREDFTFLGWEHPWFDEAMDTVLDSTLGQACVGAMSLKGVPPGSRLYEVVFTVAISAPRALGVHRFLPLSPRRVLLDAKGRDLSELLSHERLNERIEKVPKAAGTKIVAQLRQEIEDRLDDAQELADRATESMRHSAAASYENAVKSELDRLRALRGVNPSIRLVEISSLEQRLDAGIEAVQSASAKLQGVRVVLTR
ncbi:MAG: RNA polymerase-associated protein RapA [Pseudomonadota bacterium]